MLGRTALIFYIIWFILMILHSPTPTPSYTILSHNNAWLHGYVRFVELSPLYALLESIKWFLNAKNLYKMQTFYFFLSHFHAIFHLTSAGELNELLSTSTLCLHIQTLHFTSIQSKHTSNQMHTYYTNLFIPIKSQIIWDLY